MGDSSSFQLLLADGDDGEAYLDDGAPREDAAAEAAPVEAHEEEYLADISAQAGDLTRQRWAVFYPDNAEGRRLCRVLRPLVKHRAEQQGSNCLLVPVPPGLGAQDAERWTAQVYPETWKNMEHRRPRYACIVGDLDGVSLATQQALGLGHFPGRVVCPDEEAYEAYVDKVLAWERRASAPASKLLMYTVRDGTAATRAGGDHLMVPCAAHCAEIWEEERHLLPASALDVAGHDHDPDAQDFLGRVSDGDPSVLLTISHGSGPPRRRPWTPDQARERQGAMSFARDGVLMPSDVSQGAFAPGGFWFYFACFGAGTPDISAYHHWLTLLQQGGAPGLEDLRHVLKGLAPDGPFTSGLAQAALGNPDGPLNILGHLDLAWSYSFAGAKGRPKSARIADLLARVVRGERAGTILLDLQSWLHEASHNVNRAYDRARASGQDVAGTDQQRRDLGTLWMELQDLKGYVLLGDPAAQRPAIAQETRAGTGFMAGFAQHVPPAAEVPQVAAGLSFAAPAEDAPAPVPVAAPEPAPARNDPAPPLWAGTVSRSGQGPGREVILEFTRAKDASDPYAFSLGRQEYLVRGDGGTYQQVEIAWEGALLDDLQAVAEPGADPAIGQRLGDRLRDVLRAAGWSRIERELAECVDEGRPVLLTLRSAAAELFSLPWELLTMGASGRQLGALPNLLVRYEWPGTGTAPETVKPRPEGGRILFGWSAAGGRVPHKDHQETLQDTCGRGFVPFEPGRDVLGDMSPQGLVDRLQAATDAGDPVAILHLLCHGTVTGTTFGLALDGGDGRPVAVDPGRLRELLAPFAGTLRAVVLCACYGGNPGELSNHLGSVAQTLHRAGIRTVISSRFPLSTAGSTRFSRSFYERLLVEPGSLESAFIGARTELLKQARSLDWASLQLYARVDDGQDTRPIVFRPYRGLLAFQPQHARFFFGRDRERQAILKSLGDLEDQARPRYLVVAGASGTGKSSVVFAGAVPDLLGDTATARAAETERMAAMVAQLKATLGHLGDDAVSRALATLQGSVTQASGPGGRWELVRTRPGSDPKGNLASALGARQDPNARLLLIIDQFEELFTLAPEDQREDFTRRLWSLSRLPDSGVSVLTTIRVDFLGHCGDVVVDESGLRLDRVAYDENHRVFVAQMGVAEMRAAIVEPARRVGLTLEDGLAERMLAEVEGEPGALPVLSYTLDLLWQRRQNGRLTSAAYEELGGVVGALHRKADALLGSFDEAERTQARRLLVQLVGIRADGALDTRRRVEIQNMLPASEEAQLRFGAVLDAFVDARLLVRGEEGGVSTVEVAHEALIRKWDRLRDWVLEDKDKLQELQELKVWSDQCQEYRTVLRGAQLVQATAIESRFSEDIDAVTQALIRKSHRVRKRREILVRAVAAISLIAAVAFAIVGSYGLEQAQIAKFETTVAESKAEQARIASDRATVEKQKAQEAMAMAHEARDEAVQALAAAEAARGEAVQAKGKAVRQEALAVRAAREALRQQEFAQMSESKAKDTLRMLAVRELRQDPTRAASFLKSVEARGEFPAWQAEAWHVLQHPLGTRVVPTGTLATEHGVAFDAQRNRLAVALADGRVLVVDDGADAPRDLGSPGGGTIQTLAFSPDGRWLGVALTSGSVALYGGADLALVRRIDDPLGKVWTLDFSADSSQLVFGSRDGKARIVSLPDGNVVRTLEHGGAVWTADFDRSQGRLLTASADGTARVWAPDGTEESRLQICPQDRPCSALAARFDPTGQRVLASGAMNTAYVWLHREDRKVRLQGHGSYVVDADFRPSRAGQVATLTWDGVVRLFSVPSAGEKGQLLVKLPKADGPVLAMRFAGDGRSLATAHETGIVRLWRLGEGGSILQSRRLVGHGTETVAAWFDGASKQVHTVAFDGEIRTWPVSHRAMSRRVDGVNGRAVEALGYTPDGQVLVARTNDGSVAAFDRSGETTTVPNPLPSMVSADTASGGGKAASAGSGGEVYVSSPDTEGSPVVLREHYGSVHTLALSPDGTQAVTASMDGAVRLWAIPSLGALAERLEAQQSPCSKVSDRVQYLGETADEAQEARSNCKNGGRG